MLPWKRNLEAGLMWNMTWSMRHHVLSLSILSNRAATSWWYFRGEQNGCKLMLHLTTKYVLKISKGAIARLSLLIAALLSNNKPARPSHWLERTLCYPKLFVFQLRACATVIAMEKLLTANVTCSVEQRVKLYTKPPLPVFWFWFAPLAVQAYNLSSKLLKQTHQLHYLPSRTWSSDTIGITLCRKTEVLLKLSNGTIAEFFPSTAKI